MTTISSATPMTSPIVERLREAYNAWNNLPSEGLPAGAGVLLEAAATIERLSAELAQAREVTVGVMASLAAAISLLERSPKTAAPSNKMFDMMLADYRAALSRARQFIEKEPQG